MGVLVARGFRDSAYSEHTYLIVLATLISIPISTGLPGLVVREGVDRKYRKMRAKIGILNFQYSSHNYGAVLQAAALENAIKQLGYDVEHIDFIPAIAKITFKQSIRSLIGKILRIAGLKKKLKLRPNIENPHIFEDFRCDSINRSLLSYHCSEDLKKLSNKYQAIVVGSDQVWRAAKTGEYALDYFLPFAGAKCKRISYAASFGVDVWEKTNNKTIISAISKEIKKFDFVSVREDTGVNLCKDIFGIKAQLVLDPTLLVGRTYFDRMIDDFKSEDKISDIVFYKLDVDDMFINQLELIGCKLGYTIENIYYKRINGKFFYNTVEKWLMNLRESKLVITDSFHCVCFSILFQKQFIYYPNEGRGMSRLESLLGQLGLLNRICRDTKRLSEKIFMEDEINYSEVNRNLEMLRESSLKFLSTSLNDKKRNIDLI